MAQNIVEILLKARDDSQPAVKSFTAGLKQMQSQVADLKRIQADAARSVVTASTPNDSLAARADLTAVTKDLKDAETDLNGVTNALGQTNAGVVGSFRNLFTSFTAANLAANAITAGITAVKRGFTDSVQAATTYNNAMLGLSSTAASLGQSQDAARQSAKELSSDGLLSVATSANSLKQLMQSGLGLDQAVTLMGRFKDEAAYGRSETISYDQAVGNLAQAYKTNSSELGDLCLVYETPIFTDQGILMIGDIVENHLFPNALGFDIITHEIRSRPIVRHFNNGSKRSLRVTLRSGRVIEGSYDHKLYLANGSKTEFRHLCPGNTVLAASSQNESALPVETDTHQLDQHNNDAPYVLPPIAFPALNERVSSVEKPLPQPVSPDERSPSALKHANAHSTGESLPGLEDQTGVEVFGSTLPVPSAASSSLDIRTPDTQSITAAEPVLGKLTHDDFVEQVHPGGKEKLPYGTGGSESKLVERGLDGAKRSLIETATPVNDAGTTKVASSTRITSNPSRPIETSPSTSKTALPCVNGAIDSNMDVLANTQKTRYDGSSSNSLTASRMPNATPLVTGSWTTTSEGSLTSSNMSLDEFPMPVTSTLTDQASKALSDDVDCRCGGITKRSDLTTLSHELVVRLDEVVSVEDIGERPTYNITVEGDHNYFLGESLDCLTLTANSGHTDNFSNAVDAGAQTLGKMSSQLSNTEREQAKFIGYMQQSASTTGDAAAFADTYAGKLARMEYQTNQAQVAIGNGLQPALSILIGGLGNLFGAADSAGNGLKYAQMAAASLAVIVRSVADVVVGAAQIIFGAFASIVTLSWKPLEDALNGSVNRQIGTWTDFNQTITDIAEGSFDSQKGAQTKALDQMTAAQRSAIKKMNEQLTDETTSFQRANEQRTKQFQESMRDIIIAHRDKSRSLQRDIADENAAYSKQVADRQKDLNGDLASLEESHANKVTDITKKISDEKNKGLIVDGVLYREANQEKLDQLQADLDEEIAKYGQQVSKRKAIYDEDVAADKSRHDQKLTQLQTELSAELVILNTHKDQVAAVGEAQKEDDLSRLIRQNQEAGQIADRDHQERLAKIRQQATEQGVAAGSNYAGGLAGSLGASQGALNAAMAGIGSSMGTNLADSMKTSMDQKAKGFDFGDYVNTVFGRIAKDFDRVKGAYQSSAYGQFISQLTNSQNQSFSSIADSIRQALTGRASGGPVSAGTPYIVGEREPELFVPNTSGQILNGQQMQSMLGNSNGPSVHIGTLVTNNQADLSAFASELAWRMR